MDEGNDRTPSPVLSSSFRHIKKSPVDAQSVKTQEICISNDVKLRKEDSFTDTNEQKSSKESVCCHATDGE